ncbi:MAG TPA: DNA-binding response regulator, partial [Lachnospiraceae bacterium]|nr:DNA-binding response regulator [Lachnospiraceae bacterium]
MIRTAICDDEANTRAYLLSLVQAQPYPCEIVEYASA